MRSTLLLAFFFTLVAAAQEPSIQIGDAAISRGMSQQQIREMFPADYIRSAGGSDDMEIWFIAQESWEDSGVIVFENGLVRRATDHVSATDSFEVYEMLVLLNELVVELTDGMDTCAMIRTHVPQDIFPQSETRIVLPTKTIVIGTASRANDGQSGGASFRIDVHNNPIPASETVHREDGQSGHCVVR